METDRHLLACCVAAPVPRTQPTDAAHFHEGADRAAPRVDRRRNRAAASNRTRSRSGRVLPHRLRAVGPSHCRLHPSLGAKTPRTVQSLILLRGARIAWRSSRFFPRTFELVFAKADIE